MKSLVSDRPVQISLVLFVAFALWWLYIFMTGVVDAPINHWYGLVYGSYALWGSWWGFRTAKLWGGRKSLMGKVVLGLSLGLLAQGFGQYSYWYMNSVLGIEIPYPSIPDLGFFGTIPFYIYASWHLAKASGIRVSLKTWFNQIHALLIPVLMVGGMYLLLLRDYKYDWSTPFRIFFDFGYPIGDAIFVSIAILTFSLTKNVLGGVMKQRVWLLLAAFVAQFMSEAFYLLLYDFYFPGSWIDLSYLIAYFLMTLGLLNLRHTAHKLHPSSKSWKISINN